MIVSLTRRDFLPVISKVILNTLKSKREPVDVEVARDLLPDFLKFVKHNYLLFRPVDHTEEYVTYRVFTPSVILNVSPKLDENSRLLLDIRFQKKIVRMGKLVETGVIGDPETLFRYLKEWSLTGVKVLLLISTRVPARGLIITSKGYIAGAFVDFIYPYTGEEAMRVLFYTGPFKYGLLKIK